MARQPRTSARAAGQPFLTGAIVSKCRDFGYGERSGRPIEAERAFFDPVLKFHAQTGLKSLSTRSRRFGPSRDLVIKSLLSFLGVLTFISGE